MWTLIYNGIEKSLADWGIAQDWSVQWSHKSKSTVTLYTVEPFDAADARFLFDAPVVIWRDRTAIGSGGTIFWQGYVGEPKLKAGGSRQYIAYQMHDVLWLAARQIFKQVRKIFDHWTTDTPPVAVYTNYILPEVYLGEAINGVNTIYQTNGAQIIEILTWLNEIWNPTKRGATTGRDDTKDVCLIGQIDPDALFPITRQASMYCLDAIGEVMRHSPLSILWVDYATTPPTVNVMDVSHLENKTLTLTAEQEKDVEICPQYMRQIPGVYITYKRVDQVNGQTVYRIFIDKYPTETTEYTPEALSMPFDLAGANFASQQSQVTVAPITNLTLGNAAAQAAWWAKRDASLNDPAIDVAHMTVKNISIVDADGNDISLSAYPNELLELENNILSDWMGVNSIKARVKATLHYQTFTDPSQGIHVTTVDRAVVHEVTLTNAVSKTYTHGISADWAEEPPTGLAQKLYNSLKDLQYQGRIPFVDLALRADIRLGMTLTLMGPRTTFANCIVQSVTCRPCFGEMEVSFGPLAPLDAPKLLEQYRMARFRPENQQPSSRGNGGVS